MKLNPHDVAEDIMEKEKIVTTYDNESMFFCMNGTYLERGQARIKELIQKKLGDNCSNTFVAETIGHIMRSTYIERTELTMPTELINLENGVWDINEKKLYTHAEVDSMGYFVSQIPIKYNPTAVCPNIDKFISEVFPPEKTKLAYQLLAYCLYRDTPLQKAFMLIGGGRNGKSTFLQLVQAFIGQDNITSLELHEIEEGRFALAALFGKHVNIFADLPSRALVATSRFKTLTGGDMITADKKFKESFTFVPFTKLIFSANQLPRSPDDTDAFYRRWVIVEFPNNFEGEKADKKLINKLTTPQELEGLLVKCLDLLPGLLETGRFEGDMDISQMRELYTRLSDPVATFIMDVVEFDPESYVEKGIVYKRFVEFCRGHKYPVPSERQFSKALIAEGKVIDYKPLVAGVRVHCWKGMRLNSITEDSLVVEKVNVQ